jgi:carbon storage regulator
MLSLRRSPGQSIEIGDGIRITVQKIGRGTVTIGVEAPRSVPVFRSEVSLERRLQRAELDRLADDGNTLVPEEA